MRCRTALAQQASRSGNVAAAAWAAAALALYPVAMLAPFLRVEQVGLVHQTSLIGGIRSLLAEGQTVVGLVVLLFSVIFPAAKLAAMLTLSLAASRLAAAHRAITYRAVEQLGRWGMLDVLLVAVLVAFVKLGELVRFEPQPGLLFFAAFVLTSLVAGLAFDPHQLWDEDDVPNSTTNEPAAPAGLPTAIAERSGRRWLWWLLPAAAVAVSLTAAVMLVPAEGVEIEIVLADGAGLEPESPVRFRGIEVGRVERVTLDDSLDAVLVTARLTDEAADLARDGTTWWVVRPQLALDGASGLETVLGRKYLTLLPGEGEPRRRFVGLAEPPVDDLAEPGGLTVIVQSDGGSRLSRGAGVTHRGVRIGGITGSRLSSDLSAVEYEVYIRPTFVSLLTPEAKFWRRGAVSIDGSLTGGLTMTVGSASELLIGGLAMATPDAGDPVPGGTRYSLASRPDSAWLAWTPSLRSAAVETPVPLAEAVIVADWDGLALFRQTQFRRVLLGDGDHWTLPLAAWPVGDDGTVESVTIDGEPVDASPEVVGGLVRLPSTVRHPAVARTAARTPVDAVVHTPAVAIALPAARWVRRGDRFAIGTDVPDGSVVTAGETVLGVIVDGEIVSGDTVVE